MKQKLYSLFLALIMVLTLVIATPVPTKAYTAHNADEAIAWVQSNLNSKLGNGQCVGLIGAYYAYLGVSKVAGNACDYATNALPSGWQRIKGGTPQKGDILVWTGGSQGYGHVAIYESDYVTYHQNVSGKQYVQKLTPYYTLKGWDNSITYWGVIRPDFGSVPPVPDNSYYYATPVGTDGTLSLNAQPKNSDYCTRLAEIPEGAVCKVFNSGASGNWKWVEYKGISGYAYGTYLSQVYLDGEYLENEHPHYAYRKYTNGYCERYGEGQPVYDTITVAPTCTTEGYTYDDCLYCDFVNRYNNVPALEHDYKVTKEVKATCTTDGYTNKQCTRCKGTITVNKVAVKGHTIVVDKAKEVNCIEEGRTEGKHCSVCNTVIVACKPLAKKDHNYGSWKLKSAATVSHGVIQKRSCDFCGVEDTRTIGSKLKPTIKLSAKAITLKKGKSKLIKVSKLAKGDKVKSWTSSNKKVATVSSKGKIVAKKKGTAKITVKLKSGKKANVKVTVKR